MIETNESNYMLLVRHFFYFTGINNKVIELNVFAKYSDISSKTPVFTLNLCICLKVC